MAHRSALPDVLGMQIPVNPKGGQPRYFRSKKTVQTSPKLISFQSCVAEGMRGAHGSRQDIREKFAEVAKRCS